VSRYILKTLGCKANLYDSQLIEEQLQKAGWMPEGGDSAELCIINSCTVTDEADRQSRKLASKLARENPQAKIVITGCGAEVNPEHMAHTPGVHFVVGNQNKDQIVNLVLKQFHTSDLQTSHILQPEILGTAQNYKELSYTSYGSEWLLRQDALVFEDSGRL
jgi:threonylcarbamoyladenosine tRNA methylthiotransferase MtaB